MHDSDAVLSELAACTADAPFSTRPRSHVETGCELTYTSSIIFHLSTVALLFTLFPKMHSMWGTGGQGAFFVLHRLVLSATRRESVWSQKLCCQEFAWP